MFKLAHISDIHLGPLPEITYRELASKRITGYINWQRNRVRALGSRVREALQEDLERHRPDHIAVTGDLVNLALDAELSIATTWLKTLGDPFDVSVVPGNHDAYVPGSLAKACRIWGPWMRSDGSTIDPDPTDFPYLRVRDDIAIIGINTARATAPFMATGHFGGTQAARLSRMLEETAAQGLFRVVLIHHPPLRGVTTRLKRLFGIGLFQDVVRRHGAELVLHGHTHEATIHHIHGPAGQVPVVGVPAVAQGFGGRRPAARFNLFTISGGPGAWSCRMEARGIADHACRIATISDRNLMTAAETTELLTASRRR
jgi:3',5'-cyclic AMP phosphodiesterase CpdA